MGAQSMEEVNRTAAVTPESPRSPEDQETEDMVNEAPNDPETRPKSHSIDVHMDGHERGESSLRGGIGQPSYESPLEGRTNRGRHQSF